MIQWIINTETDFVLNGTGILYNIMAHSKTSYLNAADKHI